VPDKVVFLSSTCKLVYDGVITEHVSNLKVAVWCILLVLRSHSQHKVKTATEKLTVLLKTDDLQFF